ncbi:PH domain-containing protein [Arcanobacterium canis]
MRNSRIVVKEGFLWRRVVIVPLSHIQAVHVRRGLLSRHCGATTLQLCQASAVGDTSIQDFPFDTVILDAWHICRRSSQLNYRK